KDAICSEIPATTLDALRRRTRAIQGRCQGFNCHASLLMSLRGATATKQSPARSLNTAPPALRLRSAPLSAVDVLIIGGGPAGLAAALELKKLGVKDVIVAERETEAGGIPRMCGHIGFGVTDLHRVMTGPRYAQTYREMAEKAGIRVHTNTTITGWEEQHQVSYTSPNGVGTIAAKSILLATGVRERPRSARLVPGSRPQGVYTTGSLQRFVYEQHLPVGKRAVVVGAERVSLSVVLTLRHAGVKVLDMITELPHHQLYLPLFLPAKILFTDILGRVPILTNHRISNILGRPRVEGVEITEIESGKTQVIECDTVVFTGNWIPENELARRGGVETGKPSLGPQVDSLSRTSQAGVFAAGNLLRGVETADWAAHEGRGAARSIVRYLENPRWNGTRLAVQPESPLAWVYPNVLSPDAPVDGFWFRSNEFRQNVKLRVLQGERVLYQKHLRRLSANTSLELSSAWIGNVEFTGEPVKLVIHS
ncbi:MAG TPA: FAD-dependent oxidoreductase, partial [Anaerolineales bacterium]|nr:FAD-dependent oxidoreductase [Anaerolineales bacterium]